MEENKKSYPTPQSQIEKPLNSNHSVDSSPRRSSALSLSGGLKKNDKPETIELKTENLPQTPFTQAEFFVFWKKYIEILDKQGEKMLAAIINATQPEVIEHHIKLTFPNAMMLEEVRKNQVGMLNYVKKNLQHYGITFDYILNEAEEKNFIYTPQEKYQKLVEINPLMAEFRKIFDLDL